MNKVFLSHSNIDKVAVRRLARDLREHDIDVWLDEWEIKVGDSISQKIEQGLMEANYLLIWLTKSAVQSGWVDREWRVKFLEEVSQKRVIVLPILAEDIELPQLLHDKKYADFRDDYTKGLWQILDVPNLSPRLKVGEAMYRDLALANERLEKVLAPYRGAIGELWLTEPKDECWYPYRPDSLAAWNPPKGQGTWQEHRAELGIINWDLTIQAARPCICFRWCSDSEPWPAITNPHDNPESSNFTLDGLLYVRANIDRLLDQVKVRNELLHVKGLLTGIEPIEAVMESILAEFVNAGK